MLKHHFRMVVPKIISFTKKLPVNLLGLTSSIVISLWLVEELKVDRSQFSDAQRYQIMAHVRSGSDVNTGLVRAPCLAETRALANHRGGLVEVLQTLSFVVDPEHADIAILRRNPEDLERSVEAVRRRRRVSTGNVPPDFWVLNGEFPSIAS